MYGTQADYFNVSVDYLFENDVKMYGTQARRKRMRLGRCVWEWCKNVWYTSGQENKYDPDLFENDVKMYGTQAVCGKCGSNYQFENDVKMYGTQARISCNKYWTVFENDVKMYGTQAGDFKEQRNAVFENDVMVWYIIFLLYS